MEIIMVIGVRKLELDSLEMSRDTILVLFDEMCGMYLSWSVVAI